MTPSENYLSDLKSISINDITEHTHRKPLEILLNHFGQKYNPNIKVVKEIENIIGFVETKKIGEDLTEILKSDQIKKYSQLSDNILLTNYLDYIWLRKGKPELLASMGSKMDLSNPKFKPSADKIKEVEDLILHFFQVKYLGVGSPKELAKSLAHRGALLRDELSTELQRQESEDQRGRLFGLFSTFQQSISNELTLPEFADAFSQMLVYGLFLAKLNANLQPVHLFDAKRYIPNSFSLIQELVSFLDELERPNYENIRWIIEEVLTILNTMDMSEIQKQLNWSKSQVKDPYIYFYEDFLGAYDARLRKAKGVYYTPPAVVNYIVRAIDDILKTTFETPQGLADRHKVTVLDFATGTGTFLLEIMQQILEKTAPLKREAVIREHLLKNLYGFEYMIASYTIAHLKLSQYLKESGYQFLDKDRVQIFLTNTLENSKKGIQKDYHLPALAEERKKAQIVKEKQPILIITGNPPYSYASSNHSDMMLEVPEGVNYILRYSWDNTNNKLKNISKPATKKITVSQKTFIGELIEWYKFVDGKPLGEKNPKGLQDDYVKFFRFAQYKMDQVESGMVAIITNHSFLDNPTFRGMRQSLMKTFDQLYFLDLHGNAKKKERSPDGSKDENVFDIEQGVAISIMIKKKGTEKGVFISDFYGDREQKYKDCFSTIFEHTGWIKIQPSAPFYLFKEQNENLKVVYEKFWGVKDIFKIGGEGVVTSNDEVLIRFNNNEFKNNIENLFQSIFKKENVKKIDFRLFDKRFIYYDDKLVDRARVLLMKNMFEPNLALNISRQIIHNSWKHIFISSEITDKNLLQPANGQVHFPLYLYEKEEGGLFAGVEPKKTPNFTKEFLAFMSNSRMSSFDDFPEQIMSYLYAILHSPTYRSKYAEFLKIDFPRIPFTEDIGDFRKLSDLGWGLIQAHLLINIPNNSLGNIGGTNNNKVDKPHWQNNRLYLNSEMYFDNVQKVVYDFQIGGYQVLDKYLKDRKGRELSLDEVENIENIVKVLSFTIETMAKIDEQTMDWI
jgi:hypothetical protein